MKEKYVPIYKTFFRDGWTNATDDIFFNGTSFLTQGGPHSTMDSIFASHPGLILHIPENNSLLQRFIDGPA